MIRSQQPAVPGARDAKANKTAPALFGLILTTVHTQVSIQHNIWSGSPRTKYRSPVSRDLCERRTVPGRVWGGGGMRGCQRGRDRGQILTSLRGLWLMGPRQGFVQRRDLMGPTFERIAQEKRQCQEDSRNDGQWSQWSQTRCSDAEMGKAHLQLQTLLMDTHAHARAE